MATNSDILAQMKKLEGHLEKAASSTVGARPTNMFVTEKANTPWGETAEWPVEKLKALADAYHSKAAIDLYAVRNGRARISGMGPALVKLAALASGQAGAMSIARSLGMRDGYGFDDLETEHGFTSVAKAARHGVKGLNGEVRKVALAEGSGQTGGYIVPPQFYSELLTIAGEEGFIEKQAKVIPMNSRTLTLPMLDITTDYGDGISPYGGGVVSYWEQEAANFTETEPQFRQGDWTAWDLTMFTVSSNQLLADNGIGLDALLTQLFGYAMTWYKEYAFLRGFGAGSSMPLGIYYAPATIVVSRTTPNTFKLSDAANMMSHLQVRSWDDACWVMHQSLIPQLTQMVDNTSHNQLVWMTPFGDGKEGPAAKKLPKAFFNGLPIYFTEKLPSLGQRGDVMLVDWSKYVIGQRLDLQIDVSPHLFFQSNQLAWRVIARCDGKPQLNNAITDASGWSISPYLILDA